MCLAAAVFVLEPMLATGGSICKAIGLILDQGVPEDAIVVVSVLVSRQALRMITQKFPRLVMVVVAVDERLTSKS